jgi:hypothetical protein
MERRWSQPKKINSQVADHRMLKRELMVYGKCALVLRVYHPQPTVGIRDRSLDSD